MREQTATERLFAQNAVFEALYQGEYSKPKGKPQARSAKAFLESLQPEPETMQQSRDGVDEKS